MLRSAADDSAGDLFSCVSGRLSCEIVKSAVNNQRPPENILGMEATGQKGTEGCAAAFEKRWKVAGVVGVGTVLRIVVGAGISKGVFQRALAHTAGMDMHGENVAAARPFAVGETGYLHGGKGTVRGVIERRSSAQIWIIRASSEKSRRIGTAGGQDFR